VAVDAHALDPASVLRLVHQFGGEPAPMVVVGCQPATLDIDDGGKMGLSPPVEGALDEALRMVEELIEESNK
jgi:hydrogenase maturation protease